MIRGIPGLASNRKNQEICPYGRLKALDSKSLPSLPPIDDTLTKALTEGQRSLSARARAKLMTKSNTLNRPRMQERNAQNVRDPKSDMQLMFIVPSILSPEPKVELDDILLSPKVHFCLNSDTAQDLYKFARKHVMELGNEKYGKDGSQVFLRSSEGKYIKEERKRLSVCPLPRDRMLYILPSPSLSLSLTDPEGPKAEKLNLKVKEKGPFKGLSVTSSAMAPQSRRLGTKEDMKRLKLDYEAEAVGRDEKSVQNRDSKRVQFTILVEAQTFEADFALTQTCADLYKYVDGYFSLKGRRSVEFTLTTQRGRVLKRERRPLKISPIDTEGETLSVAIKG